MILSLFKSKPKLRDLIPEGFVDIHSHILPGIDDGAKTVEESLELISEMKKLGFSKIVGTPHIYEGVHNNTKQSIETSFNKLKKLKIDDVKIEYASEYMIDESLIEKARDRSLLCIKDNFVLVEMSYISAPINLYNIIFNLKTNNYIPIIAHPERYRYISNNIDEYYRLKKHGCYFQINLLSTTGYYGVDIVKKSEILLANNMIDFVGSDIHKAKHISHFDDQIKITQIKALEKSIDNNKLFK